jgi:hypothetical protein
VVDGSGPSFRGDVFGHVNLHLALGLMADANYNFPSQLAFKEFEYLSRRA